MPGTLTTAIFGLIQSRFQTPVINMFYDGQGGQNERLKVFLSNLKVSYTENHA
jgi:hypothetical protein